MGTQLSSSNGTEPPPNFSAHFYYGQTAECIKMPLGTELGLSLGDITLDGVPAPPPLKGHSPPFSVNVRCGQTAGWTNSDTTWYGGCKGSIVLVYFLSVASRFLFPQSATVYRRSTHNESFTYWWWMELRQNCWFRLEVRYECPRVRCCSEKCFIWSHF